MIFVFTVLVRMVKALSGGHLWSMICPISAFPGFSHKDENPHKETGCDVNGCSYYVCGYILSRNEFV